uniref:Putative secreted protein n=1 Tax=Anopheles marajoara TaxID=58244 RepID=A0A2M4CCM0_9DIPT
MYIYRCMYTCIYIISLLFNPAISSARHSRPFHKLCSVPAPFLVVVQGRRQWPRRPVFSLLLSEREDRYIRLALLLALF